jgi:hypothetical protein
MKEAFVSLRKMADHVRAQAASALLGMQQCGLRAARDQAFPVQGAAQSPEAVLECKRQEIAVFEAK